MFLGFPIPRPKCVAPVGMESGAIKDAAITSSSDWNAGHRAANGRLNFHAGRGRTGAWSARHNNRGQWLQVDLGKTMEIRRVATQGRHDADQWVTSYTLEYSQDGGHFYPYKNNQVLRQSYYYCYLLNTRRKPSLYVGVVVVLWKFEDEEEHIFRLFTFFSISEVQFNANKFKIFCQLASFIYSLIKFTSSSYFCTVLLYKLFSDVFLLI